MKKYDIKNTDIETLKKWYHLMNWDVLWMRKPLPICCNR